MKKLIVTLYVILGVLFGCETVFIAFQDLGLYYMIALLFHTSVCTITTFTLACCEMRINRLERVLNRPLMTTPMIPGLGYNGT